MKIKMLVLLMLSLLLMNCMSVEERDARAVKFDNGEAEE